MAAETLDGMLAEAAERVGEHPALIFQGRKITYSELDDQVSRCAAGLLARGIGKDDTFGIVLRNCPEFVVLAFALNRIGAVAVPVNFLEKGERIGFIFADAGAKGCLTAKEFAPAVRKAAELAPTVRHVFLRDGVAGESFAQLLAETLPADKRAAVQPDDLSLLIYTAGTTGEPKGVMLTHRNLLANVDSAIAAFGVNERDRTMCLLPMFHAFAWMTNVLAPFRLGARTVVIESLLPFDPVIKQIWKNRVTFFCCVPQVYAALVEKVKGPKAIVMRLLNPVTLAVSGAAPLAVEVQRGFEKTFRIPLVEGYGLTECSPAVAANPRNGPRKPGTVGVPLPGVELEIRDEDERPIARGGVGEVCVRGDNVMKGYYKRPEETAAAFTSDGWLKTGDLGFLDQDGYLTLVDRKKDLIISKGLNIYPAEIEAALVRDPTVAEAAVVGVPDNTGSEIVRAFVVPVKGQAIDKAALLKQTRAQLASYKTPREIEVVDELPKNALGKVLKRELRKA